MLIQQVYLVDKKDPPVCTVDRTPFDTIVRGCLKPPALERVVTDIA
jgi:hypothetical protein